MNVQSLFNSYPIENVFKDQFSKLQEEIEGINSNDILSRTVETLCDYLKQKYEIQAITIDKDAIFTEHEETNKWSQNGYRGRDVKRIGTNFIFHVPFIGERILFSCRPMVFSTLIQEAEIKSNEILFTYFRPFNDNHFSHEDIAQGIRDTFEVDLRRVTNTLDSIQQHVTTFNESIYEQARLLVPHHYDI